MRPTHVIAAAAMLAVVALPPVAGAALPGTVAWTREDFENNDFEVMLARADGTTGQVALTKASDHDPAACFGGCGAENPNWSPDGRVYFDASWVPLVSVWSLKPDGTDERKEPSITEFDGLPDVSLDGTLLAHEGGSLDASLEGLYVRPLGSATATRLTTDPLEYYDSNPDIAPDNSRIVFQRFYNNSARVEIWTINTDGTGLRRLLSGGRRWGDPHYSPDGSKILVQLGYERANQGNNTNEYVMNSDGTNLRPITSMPMGSFVFGGDWSPDGQHIAYMRFLRGEDHIQVRSMDANGNDEGLIADCDPVAFCHNARWSAYEGPLRAASEARASRSAQHAARRHRLSHRAAARRMARIVRRALSR